MGCNSSTAIQSNTTQPILLQHEKSQKRIPGVGQTNHFTQVTNPSSTINWSGYQELEVYRDQFYIDWNEDVRPVREVKSNYMRTEMGHLRGESILMKSIDMTGSADDISSSRKALISEITSMTRIQHANVVGFKGFSIDSERGLVCFSEYLEGGTLRGLLDNPRLFPKLTWSNEKISIAIDICSALVYMHSLKPRLIHRNIKASKVLLQKDRSIAKLSGFGASRDRSFEQEMTNKIGDIEWSAPELIMDDGDYSEKIDVYSFGVLLTELDTGSLPFADVKGSMPSSALTMKIVSGALRPQVSAECPVAIQKVVRYCLQHDPLLRPTSTKVLEMLEAAKLEMSQEPVE